MPTDPNVTVTLNSDRYNTGDLMTTTVTYVDGDRSATFIQTEVVDLNDEENESLVEIADAVIDIYTTIDDLADIPRVNVKVTVDLPGTGDTKVVETSAEIYPTEKWILDNVGVRNKDTVPLTKVTKNYNLTEGQVLRGLDITGRVSWVGANAGIEDCIVRGTVVPPTAGQGITQATNAAVVGGFINHCEIIPTTESPNWNGFEGHDMTITNTLFENVVDGVQIKKSGVAWPANNNFRMKFCVIDNLIYWTANAAGKVHPKDTETHPDCIQAMQLGNADIGWNILRGRYARQAGHWFIRRKSDGYIYKREEVSKKLPPAGEWEFIPLHSLPDGGPWRTTPDRGTGTEEDGRYNGPRVASVDSNNGDLSVLMIGDEEGKPTFGLKFIGNRCYGGHMASNGGGNTKPVPLPVGMKVATMELNLFDRSQGLATQTINFQGSNWTAADANIPTTGERANRYFVPGDPDSHEGELVRVRF